MSIRRALGVTLTAAFVLAILVYGVLFQFYSSDDESIRLMLEGRMFPDSAPSGWVIFINLALGRALAGLYRWAPGAPWYDIFEQSLLWLSLTTVLYVICRGMRTWSGAGVFACAVLIAGCLLVEIQFTTVAMISALSAGLAIAGPRPADSTPTESLVLKSLGVLLLVAGASLRLEAVALMVLYLAFAVAMIWVTRRAMPPARRLIAPGLALALAGLAIAGITAYHFRGYGDDPQWWPFYATHALRGAIIEYAPVRADPAAIGLAVKAAGWTRLDYDLLLRWTVLDPSIYSSVRLQTFLAALPPVGSHLAWLPTMRELAFYPVRYWYLGAAILALMATRLTRRTTGGFIALNVGLAALVLASSLVLKPLPHRVIWPLLAAHLAMLTLMMPPRPLDGRPSRLGLGLLVIALLGLAVQGVRTSERRRADQPRLEAFLGHLSASPGQLVVMLPGGFPFLEIERPFRRSVIQRGVRLFPAGPYGWSPLPGSSPVQDLALLLCSPRPPEVIMGPTTPALLSQFYAERRGRSVVFDPRFRRDGIDAYRCVETSPLAAKLAG